MYIDRILNVYRLDLFIFKFQKVLTIYEGENKGKLALPRSVPIQKFVFFNVR